MFKEDFYDFSVLNRYSYDGLYFSVVANNGKKPYFIISRNWNLKYCNKTRISLIKPKFVHKKHNDLILSRKEVKKIIYILTHTFYYENLCEEYTSYNGKKIKNKINKNMYQILIKKYV